MSTKRKHGAPLHLAVDTFGYLWAPHVASANEQDRTQVGRLAEAVQDAIGAHVEVTFVHQGYTGEVAAEATSGAGVEFQSVKLPEAKQGFVLLPRTRSKSAPSPERRASTASCEGERLPETVAGVHFVAFSCLMLYQIVPCS